MTDHRSLHELTVDELTSIIAKSVKQAIEDEIEDLRAQYSPEFIASVKEARQEYKSRKVKPLDDLLPGNV